MTFTSLSSVPGASESFSSRLSCSFQYLMVKFLCTRQESAERLGVQGLSISGYLRPARAEAEQNIVCAHCRKGTEESVCGATLLLKTLQFIQQLAHDLVAFTQLLNFVPLGKVNGVFGGRNTIPWNLALPRPCSLNEDGRRHCCVDVGISRGVRYGALMASVSGRRSGLWSPSWGFLE